jgi:hypothetical protein
MKQFFEIHPALFVLTSRENQLTAMNFFEKGKNPVLYRETDTGYDLAHPHVHYGMCEVNDAHTQVTLCVRSSSQVDLQFELPENLLAQLKTQTFQGKQYVITLVPVNN